MANIISLTAVYDCEVLIDGEWILAQCYRESGDNDRWRVRVMARNLPGAVYQRMKERSGQYFSEAICSMPNSDVRLIK